ncbi:MAG: stage 0 sporulation family protein [Candidatus Omnitrophota bacterium]|jgi:cell fate regulator YaaT (PSP1 superfamily)
MHGIIEVRIRESGNIALYDANGLTVKTGDYVIIDAERGQDYAQVMNILEKLPEGELKGPLKKIVRVATREDINQINENKKRTKDAFQICLKKIQERKLDMKLIDAEYSFDGTKLIFYFTSEDRVDFRELVKDLAHIFKVRIELKQIGVRDEAKMIGGFGHCGRPLCCANFLRGFDAVTIRMAKEQNLSLNPTKISGVCGRLMCCLSYEYENYKKYLKGLPREGEKITLPEGKAKVLSVNALKRKALVEFEDGKQIELDFNK